MKQIINGNIIQLHFMASDDIKITIQYVDGDSSEFSVSNIEALYHTLNEVFNHAHFNDSITSFSDVLAYFKENYAHLTADKQVEKAKAMASKMSISEVEAD